MTLAIMIVVSYCYNVCNKVICVLFLTLLESLAITANQKKNFNRWLPPVTLAVRLLLVLTYCTIEIHLLPRGDPEAAHYASRPTSSLCSRVFKTR